MTRSITNFPSERLTREEAAEYLGLDSPRTLANWAWSGRHGIPYVRIGRKIFYRKSDLDAFIDRQTVVA